MSNVPPKKIDKSVQEICIDLPGENVQCWRSSDNLKVILRKHRDVIFDLNFKAGNIYSVYSDNSEFYNARDKKLVRQNSKEKISFTDGERLHLWVTRSFKGNLIVMQGEQVLMKVSPADLDTNDYDNNPKTKPAPIVVALGNPKPAAQPIVPVKSSSTTGISTGSKHNLNTNGVAPTLASAPVNGDCPVVCVLEGTTHGMPEKILKSFNFKSGGGDSGFVDIDPNDVATRNWIWGQGLGTAAYIGENWKWLRASLDEKHHKGFQFVRVKISMKLKSKRIAFFFSGSSKYNTVFPRGGFGPKNAKIMTIFSGAGDTKSSFIASAKGVAGSFKGLALVSFIFGSATAYAEWKDDLSKDGYDFAAALIMSILKTIVVAAVISILVALIVSVVVVGALIEIPVILVGAFVIVGGFVMNYYTEALDKNIGKALVGNEKNNDGIAAAIAPVLRSAGKKINENWDHLMEKFPKDYQWIEF